MKCVSEIWAMSTLFSWKSIRKSSISEDISETGVEIPHDYTLFRLRIGRISSRISVDRTKTISVRACILPQERCGVPTHVYT